MNADLIDQINWFCRVNCSICRFQTGHPRLEHPHRFQCRAASKAGPAADGAERSGHSGSALTAS